MVCGPPTEFAVPARTPGVQSAVRAGTEVSYLMTRRKAIRLAPHEDDLLRRIYVRFNIPSDQYKRRPSAAARFLSEWNAQSNRSDEWGDVLHYIVTKRKAKRNKWPTLGDGHRRMADPAWELLSDGEWAALEAVYSKLLKPQACGSDNLLYDAGLAAQLARMFCAETGRSLPSPTLVGLILSRRKRGEWVLLQPKPEQPKTEEVAVGWGDIDQVGSAVAGHLRPVRSAI